MFEGGDFKGKMKTIELLIEKPSVETEVLKLRFEVLYPGGNTTALVEGLVDNPRQRKELNKIVMASDSNIEQVGCYDLSNFNRPKLQMAGNELCINAIRALAYLVCLKSGGKIKEFEVEVILENRSLFFKAGVNSLRQAWVELATGNIPIVDDGGIDTWTVPLEGITQVVTTEVFEQSANLDSIKNKAKSILQQRGLLDSVPAAGVTFISKNSQGLAIMPVVWVKDVETLFLETACGSATIAAYLALTDQQNRCNIQQPSGLALQVETRLESGDNQARVLRISGPVSRIK